MLVYSLWLCAGRQLLLTPPLLAQLLKASHANEQGGRALKKFTGIRPSVKKCDS